MSNEPAHLRNTYDLVQLYIFQLSHGCGEASCRGRYCASASFSAFRGQVLSESAVRSLAEQLAGCSHVGYLCGSLKREYNQLLALRPSKRRQRGEYGLGSAGTQNDFHDEAGISAKISSRYVDVEKDGLKSNRVVKDVLCNEAMLDEIPILYQVLMCGKGIFADVVNGTIWRRLDLDRVMLFPLIKRLTPDQQSCFFVGGPCRLTTNAERSMDGQNEIKSSLTLHRWYKGSQGTKQVEPRVTCLQRMFRARAQTARLKQAARRVYRISNHQGYKFTSFFYMTVDRNNLIGSAFNELARAMQLDGLYNLPLRLRFDEADHLGADLGGLQAEFFQELGAALLSSRLQPFSETDNHQLWFNYDTTANNKQLQYFGILFGVAFLNNCVIGAQFPSLFYRFLQEGTVDLITIEDIKDMSPVLAKSLEELVNNEVDSVYVSFQCDYKTRHGTETHQLPSYCMYNDGRVTKDNVRQYLKEYLEFKYKELVHDVVQSFCSGLWLAVPRKNLANMSVEVLKRSFEGDKFVSTATLEKCTNYENCNKNSANVKYFWSVLKGFDERRKALFLKFVTGCERLPPSGSSSLKFTVVQDDYHTDGYLPTAHTCLATLNLPKYTHKGALRWALEEAIQHSQGFGMM